MTSHAALAITLLVVVIAPYVTSQQFLQSNGRNARSAGQSQQATSHALGQSRHDGFEWKAKQIGNKKVATISIRKDEERDRRSVPLGDLKIPLHRTPTVGVSPGGSHAHRHHHGEVEWGRRRAEEEEEEDYDDEEEEEDEDDDAPPRHLLAGTGILQDVEEEEEEDDPPGGRDDSTSLESASRLYDLLYATGPRTQTVRFSNVTRVAEEEEEEPDEEEEGRIRRRKRGKKGKKVKRERKRRGKDGKKKKKKKKKGRKGKKRCRKLKGREKKKCKQEEDKLGFIKNSITMSGSEACQYHNLEECYKKVGFILDDRSMEKCRYREDFLECMELQREGTCDPDFQTEGDMTALRNRIRDVIWTTNSCLISEAIEG